MFRKIQNRFRKKEISLEIERESERQRYKCLNIKHKGCMGETQNIEKESKARKRERQIEINIIDNIFEL